MYIQVTSPASSYRPPDQATDLFQGRQVKESNQFKATNVIFYGYCAVTIVLCVVSLVSAITFINKGFPGFLVYPFPNVGSYGSRVSPFHIWIGYLRLRRKLCDLPLRMIDAMHLAIAKEIQTDIFATADSIMAAGAEAMGFSVVRFDGPEILSPPIFRKG